MLMGNYLMGNSQTGIFAMRISFKKLFLNLNAPSVIHNLCYVTALFAFLARVQYASPEATEEVNKLNMSVYIV